MQGSYVKSLEDRITQLERANRHKNNVWLWLLGLLIALTISWTALPKARRPEQVPEVVRAQRFELVDSKGQLHGRWMVMPKGGSDLILVNQADRVGISLNASGEGAHLILWDNPHKGGLVLHTTDDSSALYIDDSKGRRRVWLEVTNAGGNLSLLDTRGVPVFGIPSKRPY